MAACTDSDFPCPGTSRDPAKNTAVINSHTTRNLTFFFFSILSSPLMYDHNLIFRSVCSHGIRLALLPKCP